MGLCKDCKYFKEEKEFYLSYAYIPYEDEEGLKGKKFGNCSCKKFINPCEDKYSKIFAEKSEFEELKIEDDYFVLKAGEEYYEGFNVGGNFGCVHFEEKDK